MSRLVRRGQAGRESLFRGLVAHSVPLPDGGLRERLQRKLSRRTDKELVEEER